jgi:predicted GNAT superfamily acetyltransferase
MRLDARTDAALVTQADAAASAAADTAGVRVTDSLHTAELQTAARLFAAVWETRGRKPPVTAELMRALSYEGNYVAAAFRTGTLVGGSVGFLYALDGRIGLHSHITGVLPHEQGRNTGFALKLHQRAWALRRGIALARWTYDPLVRRNAYFNITKLGGEVAEFLPNFYGEMSDGMNSEDDTDRCLVAYRLTAHRVVECSEGRHDEPDTDALVRRGATVALDEDVDGGPAPGRHTGDVRLVRVPADAIALRASNPDKSRAWRIALRDAMTKALADGLRVTGFTRPGWYVLKAKAS